MQYITFSGIAFLTLHPIVYTAFKSNLPKHANASPVEEGYILSCGIF